jgi:hypothetical protein
VNYAISKKQKKHQSWQLVCASRTVAAFEQGKIPVIKLLRVSVGLWQFTK